MVFEMFLVDGILGFFAMVEGSLPVLVYLDGNHWQNLGNSDQCFLVGFFGIGWFFFFCLANFDQLGIDCL